MWLGDWILNNLERVAFCGGIWCSYFHPIPWRKLLRKVLQAAFVKMRVRTLERKKIGEKVGAWIECGEIVRVAVDPGQASTDANTFRKCSASTVWVFAIHFLTRLFQLCASYLRQVTVMEPNFGARGVVVVRGARWAARLHTPGLIWGEQIATIWFIWDTLRNQLLNQTHWLINLNFMFWDAYPKSEPVF